MARWNIKNASVTYAERPILFEGAHLANTEASLSMIYGAQTVDLVGRGRAGITDKGNAAGSFVLPVCVDYESFAAALSAMGELQKWADAHTTGALAIKAKAAECDPIWTGTGSDRALFNWFELPAQLLHAGEVESIAIQCRSSAADNMTRDAVCLQIWEDDGEGGWRQVARSANAEVQEVGKLCVWRYAEGAKITGRALRFCLSPLGEEGWYASAVFGAQVVNPAPDGASLRYNGAAMAGLMPEMGISFYEEDTLRYNAALLGLSTKIALAQSGYRLTHTWEFSLT